MYIRRTQTRNSATGEAYYTQRLVQSVRVGNQVRQTTLLNLGRHFALAQEEWPALCARLEELRSGQGALLGGVGSMRVEREAQRLFARLLARQPVAATTASAATTADVQAIDVDSVELSRPRTVGVEAVGLWAMAEVDLVGLLQALGLTGPQRALIVGAIIGRMAAPGSERATHRWLGERSGLGELLDIDFEALPLVPFYRAADGLMRHRAVIEQRLFARSANGLPWIGRSPFTISPTPSSRGRPPATPRPSGDTPRRSAATARWSPWDWCSMAAALCAAPRPSTAMWSRARPWRTCSTGWGPHGARWW
jgi:hypothetical protein